MPCVVVKLAVQNSNRPFNLGNFHNASPKENSKTYNGSNSANVTFVINTFNGVSTKNTLDSDVADQNQIVTV
ncbi:spore germination protein [Bacillus thuringiensis]|nr:spore germination protein [Bacillus thuringiensis]